MTRLNNPWNTERLKKVRAEQSDPLVQYIIVRKSSPLPIADLAAQAAQAVREAAIFADDPRYAENYALWLAQSFRKKCKRARDSEWLRLQEEFDHKMVGDVMALPPRKHSEREELLDKMNLLRSVKVAGALPIFDGPAADTTFLVNADLGMSDGKTIAQVCHGALRTDQRGTVAVTSATAEQMNKAAERWDVWTVQDAGHTEVAPGSETVLVLDRPDS